MGLQKLIEENRAGRQEQWREGIQEASGDRKREGFKNSAGGGHSKCNEGGERNQERVPRGDEEGRGLQLLEPRFGCRRRR